MPQEMLSEHVRFALYCLQNKESTALLDEWKSKKEATEGLLKLLQSYKDLGDSKGEVRSDGSGTFYRMLPVLHR